MNIRGLLPATIFLIAVSLFSFTLFNPTKSHSVAGHLVISEVQVAGAHADDEFVELYNPTDQSISISNLRLTKKTSGGTESNLIASLSGSIAAHHYYLVANPAYTTIPLAPDAVYSATSSSLAIDNTILLYGSDHTTIIDKVGMGSANEKEASAAANPATGQSIERKALSTADSNTMKVGGADEFKGNGEDTNNNAADFIMRSVPQPQNASSLPEPVEITPTPTIPVTPSLTPTPTMTPTLTPTATPTQTPTPTMTPTPTLTMTPTPTATPTPTMTITPTPTVTPTVLPTTTPTATPTPTLSVTPSATPSPTITPTITPAPLPNPATDVFGYVTAVMKQLQHTFSFYFPFLKFY